MLLRLAGELDLATVPPIFDEIDAAHRRGVGDVTFDLAAVTFMNGRGFALIAHAHNLGMTVTVRGASPVIRRYLEMVGIDLIATIE